MWSPPRARFILVEILAPQASNQAQRQLSPAQQAQAAGRAWRERPVCGIRLAVLFVALLAIWAASLAQPLLAQSSVRPPGNAITLEDAPGDGPLNTLGDRSDTDLWDLFRGGNPNDPAVIFGLDRPPEAQMTTTGQLWRLLRENYIRKYLGWAPAAVIGLLAVFYLLRGPMRLKEGRSGRTLPRFTLTARVGHWFMASVFIILAVTGLMILLGRPLIAPYLGITVNSIVASAAMQGHNLFGPLFILALVWIFFAFVRGNFFQLVDFRWILRLGGFFGGHASSSKFNFGEKSWFWLLILLGVVMSATGIALVFPWLFEDLRILQLSTILHVLGAVVLISVAIGHIYIGSIGMEGSLDSMLKGEVDENWAREHHDLWYEEVTGKPANAPGDTPEGAPEDAAPAATGKAARKGAGT